MRITVIIENESRREDLTAQYGLSLLVETRGGSVLMDAGSDGSALANFLKLGFRPEQIGTIAVSHNHFDHFGGVSFFLDVCQAEAYISREARRDLYVKPFLRRRERVSRTDIIERYGDRFVFVDDQTEVFPGAFLCRVRSPDSRYFCKDRRLRQLSGGRLVPDGFTHEIYLAVLEDGACKIVSSCSHNGIVNIVRDAGRRFEGVPVTGFAGGLHMRGRSSDSLNCSRAHAAAVFSAVEELGLCTVYTGHCTGRKAFGLLERRPGMEAHYFSTGDAFEL